MAKPPDSPAPSGVLRFFALTFAATWICYLATLPLARDSSAPRNMLLLLGTFAPSLVALGLSALEQGMAGPRELVRRILEPRATTRWYLFALGYMGAIKLAVALAYRVLFGGWPRLGESPWYAIMGALILSTPAQAGEEIGWRGYALGRMAVRLGMGRASVLLGLLWGLWHLPFFLAPGLDNSGQSFPIFVLGVIPLSVAIAWLYANTRGSLLLTMLMHSAVNQTVGIVPSATLQAADPYSWSASRVAWLTTGFLWIAAAYLLFRMRRIKWSGVELNPPTS